MAKPQRNNRRRPRQQEPKEYDEAVIQLDRVTRVVKGGRRLRFRATVAIGNHKGKVGVGVAKSNEVVGAIKKAVTKAKQNLITVPITKDDTIGHRTQSKFKASKILLIPAGPGTGIIAGGATRVIIELSGIKNILSKTLGSSNKLNNSKATIEALKALRARKDDKEFKEEKKKPATPKKDDKKPAGKKPTGKKPAPKQPVAKKDAPKKDAPKKESPKK